jgi:hypothetical protein
VSYLTSFKVEAPYVSDKVPQVLNNTPYVPQEVPDYLQEAPQVPQEVFNVHDKMPSWEDIVLTSLEKDSEAKLVNIFCRTTRTKPSFYCFGLWCERACSTWALGKAASSFKRK